MKNIPIVISSILLLIGTVLFAATLALPAHAASPGVVCIIPDGGTACGSNPAPIFGTVGSQARVSVFIQNSGGLNGFDIILLANHNTLKPAGADLTGTVLQGPQQVIEECLGGRLVTGNVCSSNDNADTLHFAALNCLGCSITSTPTTGLLFTAIYNVTAGSTGTPLGFQTGCSQTSVSDGTCVTIANGSATSVPETVQTATFSTSTTPDFVISANPTSLTLVQGTTGTSTLSITSVNGFFGTVSLTSTISPSGPSVTGPSSVDLSANQTVTATITVTTSTSTPTGAYVVTVTGTSGSLSHSVTISVTVTPPPSPDFSISASPVSISIAQGSSGSSTVSLASLNGFAGTVSLSSNNPIPSATITLSSTSVALSSGGTGSSVLTVQTTTSTTTGVYTVTVTGTSGAITHTVSITVTVSSSGAGDFTITDSATFISIPVGSERQTVVTVASVNGFSGNVNLVATPSSSAFACWFTTLTNTATVFVPSGGSVQQFPTCGAGRPAGSYTLTITGTSGSLSHAVTLGVNIADFSMAAPASISFASGSSTADGVTFTSLSGFAGTITVSATSPTGLSASCPSSVTLTSGSSTTVTCSLSSSTPGTYNLNVTGVFVCTDCYYNGKDVNSAITSVTVSPPTGPDFSLTANPSSIAISTATSGTSTITVTAFNGFSSTVSLTVAPSSGLTATISPSSVLGSGTATLTVSATMAGTYTAQVTGTSGSLSHSVTVTVTVTAAPNGIVCILQSGVTSCPSSPASITGAVGTQLLVSVFIQNSPGLNGFDVTLLADHTILRPAGYDLTGTVLLGTPTVLVACIGGVLKSGNVCAGTDTVDTIHLAAVSAPGQPLTTAPTTGLLFTAIYNITGTSAGTSLSFQTGCGNQTSNPPLCVNIANGTPNPVPERTQTAVFSNSGPAPDFTISSSVSSVTVARGQCDGSTVLTVTSVNGFSGTVSLTASTSSTGLTATLSATSVTLAPGGSATSVLTVCASPSIAAGTYSATVTGVSGSFSHSVNITIVIPAQNFNPDFTITATPTTQTIHRGSSATFTVSIRGTNGFNGTVSLTTTISPMVNHGPTISLPSSVGPNSDSTLTMSTARNTPTGTYTITLTATSGSITHKVTITLIVTK